MSFAAPERLLSTPSWLLTQVASVASRRSREIFDAHDAGRYHFALLAAVEEFGPLSQADLGKHLHLDRKDVALRTAELEERGEVSRTDDATDPRRKLVELTDVGAARLEELEAALGAAQDDVTAPLSARERAELVRLLRRLREHHVGD